VTNKPSRLTWLPRRSLQGVRELAGRRYSDSVIRRTVLLALLVATAFGANFLVQYFAAALFPVADFGVFYVANTVGNILFSGSLILNMYFTRHLVGVQQLAGESAAFAAMRRLERVVIIWGAVGSAVIFLAMFNVASRVGVQSWLVLLLIILDSYTAYVGDLGRVMLQSLRRTVQLGLYTLIWMVLRLILCVVGIVVFDSVWGALAGVVASSVLVCLGFHVWVAKSAGRLETALPSLPRMVELLPFIAGYGLMIAMSNLDILLSYFLLPQADVGVYSASSIFPKAILVVTMPLLQMLFPMLLHQHASNRDFKVMMLKSLGVVAVLTAAGTAMVWLTADWLCGGSWGLRNCQPGPLDILLLSVVPLALLRILVLLQFTRGQDWLAIWLAIPTVLYVWVAWHSARDITTVAWQFAGFSGAALVFLLLVQAVAEMLRPRLAH
jgi:O-antigen/teichoic acid export membrane protein